MKTLRTSRVSSCGPALAVFSLLGSLAVPCSARADGIDIYWVLTHVNGWRADPTRAAQTFVVLLTINFMWNAGVMALPVTSWGTATLSRVARDLVGYTLLAQVIDRVCAIGSFILGAGISPGAGAHGDQVLGAAVGFGVIGDLLLATAAIGLLARHYAQRRWGLPARRATQLGILAGIFTNPAWLMFAAF